MAQQLDARFAIARLAFQLDGAIDQRDPDLVRLAHAARELEILAEVIQQLALGAAAGEGLEFMLAVNVDDQRTDIAQQVERHGNAVEITARASVGGDDTSHGEVVFRLDRLFGEQLAQAPAGFR